MRSFLITGGAGFIGSSLAVRLKQHKESTRVIAIDNLSRRGSDLNVARLTAHGVEFIHGDVRRPADLARTPGVDCVIACAADPSVTGGYRSGAEPVVETNVLGTLNSLEVARRHDAAYVLLSTSRVYPHSTLNALEHTETESRYQLREPRGVDGLSAAGIAEGFPLGGIRSLYGACKLAAELIVHEYLVMYNLRGLINRCSVVAGPWQMARADQGFVTLWVARHLLGGSLSYLGFEGTGKQVRDVLHVDDLYRALDLQLAQLDALTGQVFNVGGGDANTVSLRELTALCVEATGTTLPVASVAEPRPDDVRVYYSDCSKLREHVAWAPALAVPRIIEDIAAWIVANRQALTPIFEASE